MKRDQKQPNMFRELLGEPTEAKTSGLAFSAATVLPYLLSFAFSVICAALGLLGDGVEKKEWFLYASFLLPQISFATVAFGYFHLTKTSVKSVVGKPKPMDFVLAVMLQFGLFSLGGLNSWFVGFLESLGLKIPELTHPSLNGFGLYGVLLTVAVLPAIFEETIFRGVLLKGLKSFPWWAAALISGTMFSLFHQNPAQTIYQFFCGAAFALIAIRSGSILPTVVAHFLNNAFIILAEKFAWQTDMLPIMIDSAVCLLLALAYLLVGFMKDEKNDDSEEAATESVKQKSNLSLAEKAEKKHFFLCAAVGFLVCVIGWIAGLFGG